MAPLADPSPSGYSNGVGSSGSFPSYKNHQEIGPDNEYLYITILEARNLWYGDSDYSSDPFIKVSVGGKSFTTPVKTKTLYPVWGREATYAVHRDDLRNSRRLAGTVYDQDLAIGGLMKVTWDNLGHFGFDVPLPHQIPREGCEQRWVTVQPPKEGMSTGGDGVQRHFGQVRVVFGCGRRPEPEHYTWMPEVEDLFLHVSVLEAQHLPRAASNFVKVKVVGHHFKQFEAGYDEWVGREVPCPPGDSQSQNVVWRETSPYRPFTVDCRKVDYVKLAVFQDNAEVGKVGVRLPRVTPGEQEKDAPFWYHIKPPSNKPYSDQMAVRVRFAWGPSEVPQPVEMLGCGFVTSVEHQRQRTNMRCGSEMHEFSFNQAKMNDILYVMKYDNGVVVPDLDTNVESRMLFNSTLRAKAMADMDGLPEYTVWQSWRQVEVTPPQKVPLRKLRQPCLEHLIQMAPDRGDDVLQRFRKLHKELMESKQQLTEEQVRVQRQLEMDAREHERMRHRNATIRMCTQYLRQDGLEQQLPDIFGMEHRMVSDEVSLQERIAEQENVVNQIQNTLSLMHKDVAGNVTGHKLGQAGAYDPPPGRLDGKYAGQFAANTFGRGRGAQMYPLGPYGDTRRGYDAPSITAGAGAGGKRGIFGALLGMVRGLRQPPRDEGEFGPHATAMAVLGSGHALLVCRTALLVLNKGSLPAKLFNAPMLAAALTGMGKCVLLAGGRSLQRGVLSGDDLQRLTKVVRVAQAVTQPLLLAPLSLQMDRQGVWANKLFHVAFCSAAAFGALQYGDVERRRLEETEMMPDTSCGVIEFRPLGPGGREHPLEDIERNVRMGLSLGATVLGTLLTLGNAGAAWVPAAGLARLALMNSSDHLVAQSDGLGDFLLLYGIFASELGWHPRRRRRPKGPVLPAPPGVAPADFQDFLVPRGGDVPSAPPAVAAPQPEYDGGVFFETQNEDPYARSLDWYKKPVNFVRLVLGLPERDRDGGEAAS